MKLLSSKDTVDFLSNAAPRVWIHRMLKWMILDRELEAYADKVIVQPYASVFDFTVSLSLKIGESSGPKMDEAIAGEFSHDFAQKLIGKGPHDRVYDEINVVEGWANIGSIDPGFFVFASYIDWDSGIFEVDWIDNASLNSDLLFPSQDFVGSEFDRPSYEVKFEGLRFNAGQVEMLLPNSSLDAAKESNLRQVRAGRLAGRPPKWNWDGAMAFVVGQAQTPDGLPTGAGAQARIEEMIGEWFVNETGDSPAPSQIRQRASLIMKTLETPKMEK